MPNFTGISNNRSITVNPKAGMIRRMKPRNNEMNILPIWKNTPKAMLSCEELDAWTRRATRLAMKIIDQQFVKTRSGMKSFSGIIIRLSCCVKYAMSPNMKKIKKKTYHWQWCTEQTISKMPCKREISRRLYCHVKLLEKVLFLRTLELGMHLIQIICQYILVVSFLLKSISVDFFHVILFQISLVL